MPRRAATTIVLITRQELVRADFTSGSSPGLAGLWTQPRPELPDQGAMVQAALALGPRAGRQVWVLSGDLWTQTLALAASRTVGLARDELANALNFEAETMSGQAAFESTVAQVPVQASGMDKVYWLVQVHAADFELVDSAVRHAGSRLAGFTHPGGVPSALAQPQGADASWRRAELWPDTVICLQGKKGGKAEVHVVNSAPQLGRWQAEWQGLQRGSTGGHEEMLVDIGVAAPAAADNQVVVRLDEEAALRTWLTAWATALAGKTIAVPMLRAAKRPLSAGQRWAMALALAIVTGIACAGHYKLVDAGLKDAQDQMRIAMEPTQTLTKLTKQAKELEAKNAEAKKQQENLAAQLGLFQLQRERLARLTACLSEHRPEQLFIEKLDGNGGEPRLHGVCWEPQLADRFATKLAEVLPPVGWAAEAPKKKIGSLVAGGGPCTFTIQFRAVGVASIEMGLTAGKSVKARP